LVEGKKGEVGKFGSNNGKLGDLFKTRRIAMNESRERRRILR
jgi:hypothetical protein